MHDIAIGDDIFLAFQPKLAGIARAGFAVEGNIVAIGDSLGTNESLFEIGVDHAGRGGRLGAAMAISPFGGFILLLSSIASVVVGVVFSRIVAEFILIVFRINEHLGAIRDQGQTH